MVEARERDFFRTSPEGAVVLALDGRRDGLLFGAVELRDGGEAWLDYELEPAPGGVACSLYRGAGEIPALAYWAGGRRAEIVSPPRRTLIVWNRGPWALSVDGEPLSPGEVSASTPAGAAPWMLRFAGWLPRRN